MPILLISFFVLIVLAIWFGFKKRIAALVITLIVLAILIGFWIWLGTQIIHVDYFF